MSFGDHSPGLVVAAVNDLIGAGKDSALEQLAAARSTAPAPPDATGVLWVLRVLFDVPPGMAFPTVALGTPVPAPPPDPATLPRFPIDIVCDVPFLVVRGYLLAGVPQDVEDHLAFFAEYGRLRDSPLSPAAGDERLEHAFDSHWATVYDDEPAPDITDIVRAQIARLT